MNLYLISQTVNNGYDSYDSAVVAAQSDEEARKTHPSEFYVAHKDGWGFVYADGRIALKKSSYDWCKREDVVVEFIGCAHKAIKPGVICASFNAG